MKELDNKCNARTEVYSRIVGYFRPVQQWNVGKKQEYFNRKMFRVDPQDDNILEFPVTADAPMPCKRISGNVAH